MVGFFSPSVLNVFVLNSQVIVKTLVTSNGYCVKLQDASVLPLNFMTVPVFPFLSKILF